MSIRVVSDSDQEIGTVGVFLYGLVTKISKVVAVFMIPVLPLFLLVGIGVAFDTYAGRWSAKKIAIRDGKDPNIVVTSRKTKNGVIKKICIYLSVLLFSHFASVIFVDDLIKHYVNIPVDHPFTVATCLILLSMEYDSIDEKIKWVDGIGVTQRIKNFIKKLKAIIKLGSDVNNHSEK